MESVGQSITKTQQTSITRPSFMFIVIKCQVLQIGVRNMELGKDLKQVLEDFSTLSASYKFTTDQIDVLKKTLEEKEKELVEVHDDIASQRRENQERQKLVNIIDSLVAAIPDYKKKIGELEEFEGEGKARLKAKIAELVEMKHKHRQQMAGLEENMAKEYAEEKEQERIRMDFLA